MPPSSDPHIAKSELVSLHTFLFSLKLICQRADIVRHHVHNMLLLAWGVQPDGRIGMTVGHWLNTKGIHNPSQARLHFQVTSPAMLNHL